MSSSFAGTADRDYHPSRYVRNVYRERPLEKTVMQAGDVIGYCRGLEEILKNINAYTRNRGYNHDSTNEQYHAYMRAVMSCDVFVGSLQRSGISYNPDRETAMDHNDTLHIHMGMLMEKSQVFYDNLSDWDGVDDAKDAAKSIKKLYEESYRSLKMLLAHRTISHSQNCDCERCGHTIIKG